MLVTGASGFIGSHAVRAALDRGHEVTAAVRSRAGSASLERLSPRLRIVEAELSDQPAMRRAGLEASADLALHLGWSIGPHCYDAPDNLECVGGSLALLRGLVEAGCPRVVFVGTHLELAPGDGELAEDAPIAPSNLYAVCKDAVHRVARSFAGESGTSFVWARLFNLYGPGQPDWALVSFVIRHLLEGRRCPMTHGEQVRTFLHVRDVAEALLAVGESSVGGVVHVGSDRAVTVREVGSRVGDQLGRAELLSFGELAPKERDAPRIVPSCHRLFDEVGFRPSWGLDEGLADTIDWWRSQIPSAVAT